jgi:hypothetical protein
MSGKKSDWPLRLSDLNLKGSRVRESTPGCCCEFPRSFLTFSVSMVIGIDETADKISENPIHINFYTIRFSGATQAMNISCSVAFIAVFAFWKVNSRERAH